MNIEFTDFAIYIACIMIYLICGYGVNKDLNEIHGYSDFKWPNLLVVLLWPAFILMRSLVGIWSDLK